MGSDLAAIRNTPPADADWLWDWVYNFTGVKVARAAVCPGHRAPFDAFAHQVLARPRIALWLGSRGSGKSFLSALDTHLASRFHRGHGTRILGGSLAQSEQIYDAIRYFVLDGAGPLGSDAGSLAGLLKQAASYRNGSEVSILACSARSVRGPHVPSLKLDEVDEIDPEHRQSAMGMCMAKGGTPASVLMTSTWHRVGGPMAELIERGEAGAYPVHRFCAFEVLARCPESRSGRPTGGPDLYEHCPACPLRPWCHADVRPATPGGPPLPKAKRSAGHYAIDSLIQKVETVSLRVFEADYLCSGPKADGVWFRDFDEARHVAEAAEYDPALPVHVSVDSGVFTGAVWMQVRETAGGKRINVFADYLAEGLSAEENARAIVGVCGSLCRGRRERVSTDPAGGSRNPIGPTVIAEYERAGLRPTRTRDLERWPVGPVADSLAAVEALLASADGAVSLTVHPRCRDLIAAFGGYRRAKRAGQWQDYPQDPNHPAEDLIDALRGGIKVEMPEGRRPAPAFRRVPAARIF